MLTIALDSPRRTPLRQPSAHFAFPIFAQNWNGGGNGTAEVLGSFEEAWALTGHQLTQQQMAAQRTEQAVLSLLARLNAQHEGWRQLSQETATLPALCEEIAALRATTEQCIAQAEALSTRIVEVRRCSKSDTLWLHSPTCDLRHSFHLAEERPVCRHMVFSLSIKIRSIRVRVSAVRGRGGPGGVRGGEGRRGEARGGAGGAAPAAGDGELKTKRGERLWIPAAAAAVLL